MFIEYQDVWIKFQQNLQTRTAFAMWAEANRAQERMDLKTLGRNSFAALLNALLGAASIMLWAVLAIIYLFFIPAFTFDAFHDLSWVENTPPALVWPPALMLTVLIIAAQIVISRLRRIFRTLIAGDPFVPENARRLRTIWITLVVAELARVGFGSGMLLLQRIFADSPHLEGLHGNLNINWPLWLAVAALVVLAEVFHEGARLRQEQKLTI